MAYVGDGKRPARCVFCEQPKVGDEEALILWRGDLVFIMLNTFPYNTGHLLVSPYRHIADPLDLQATESAELLYGIRIAMECLRRAFRPEGFNIGANIGQCAGAGFADHMHVHVVPRWPGDTNFMAVAASCRIVPEALQETHRRLKQALAERDSRP
jgi:ATP adenylyltransferase